MRISMITWLFNKDLSLVLLLEISIRLHLPRFMCWMLSSEQMRFLVIYDNLDYNNTFIICKQSNVSLDSKQLLN